MPILPHNLWRLPEVPLQDQEMANMGARQCSSETVMIIHTFFRVCHRNLCQPFLPTSKCRELRTAMMIPGWRRRGQGGHVLQMQNESGKAGFF